MKNCYSGANKFSKNPPLRSVFQFHGNVFDRFQSLCFTQFGDSSKVPTIRIVLPFSKFDFYRLELRRESLNCPVDRNILIRGRVSEHTTTTTTSLIIQFYHFYTVVCYRLKYNGQERLLSVFTLFYLLLLITDKPNLTSDTVLFGTLMSIFGCGWLIIYEELCSEKKSKLV